MEEFLKIDWEAKPSAADLEKQTTSFVSDEALLDSYVYQHLKKPIALVQKTIKLSSTTFYPGSKYLPYFPKRSILSKKDQEACFTAMKLIAENKRFDQMTAAEKNCLQIHERQSANIAKEHALFNEYVKAQWENQKFINANNPLFRYAWTCCQEKFKRYLDYGDFYKEEKLLNMTYIVNDNVTIDVNCIENLLELGTLARFSQPSLKVMCKLGATTLPENNKAKKYSQLPVSQDKNARNLIENNDVDVVISSSGLQRLFDSYDKKAEWKIPVKVEMIKTKKGTEVVTKKVVFIDKPLMENHKDPIYLKYYSIKRLLKTNFCQYEAFKFKNQDSYPDDSSMTEEDEGSEHDDTLGKITKSNVIHHNASYRLWKFQKIASNTTLMKNVTKSNEFNLLVRAKLDACETTPTGVLQPVVVKPKLELQLKFGANIPTLSELCNEWTSLFFRPYSILYRARTHWKTAEVIDIEKCTLQKVVAEANSLYQCNFHLGLGVLNDLCSNLLDLEPGSYMLVHLAKHETFVGLYSKTDSSTNSLDMNKEFSNCQLDEQVKSSWLPIDLNYILPINKMQQRPPGLFMPWIKKQGAKSSFQKKLNKKKKKTGSNT